MSNMSYCRFSNTLADLQDCYEALREGKKLSQEEEKAKDHLLELCSDILHLSVSLPVKETYETDET
jgi:hypothetical protein